MYLQQLPLTSKSRILHLAPELGIYRALSRVVETDNYEVTDIDPSRYSFAKGIRTLDLCNLDDLRDNHYDLILHSHVLEHIPCNIAYTLFHLHRALKPDGWHVCVIPFVSGHYDECYAKIPDQERIRRFGQDDHVRRFGRDDVDRHLGSIMSFDKDFDAARDFRPDLLAGANIPESAWRGLTAHTVLRLRKWDMKLLRPNKRRA